MTAMPPSGSRSIPKRARKAGGNNSGLSAALKAGAEEVSKPSEANRPRKAPQIRIAKGTYGNLLATKVLRALGIGFVVIALIYFCFAITIVRVIPSSTIGMTPVKNITFPGALIPAEETVIVDLESRHGTDILDYMKQAFTVNNSTAVMKVYAGPYGKFRWSAGTVSYDEKDLPFAMTEPPVSDTLTNQYLAACISGACVPGQGYVISAAQIIGQPLG